MRMKCAALIEALMSIVPRQHLRLIGDEADDPAVQAREADDQVLRPELVHLEEAAVVRHVAMTSRTS